MLKEPSRPGMKAYDVELLWCLTSKRAAGEAENQASALRAEGVDVREIEGLGGWAISLKEFGWFPEALSED